MATFKLHPVLAADTLPISRLTVSKLLLMNDCRFPWCILVPRTPGLTEWHQLAVEQQSALQSEIDTVARSLLELPGISKINIGALGNRVEQLHIHVIGRHAGDPAWPGPVWGHSDAQAYSESDARRRIEYVEAALRDLTSGARD